MPRKPSLRALRLRSVVETAPTLTAAADAAGISTTTLFEAEHGRRNLSRAVMRKLARIYGVTVDEIAAALETSKREVTDGGN